MIVRAGGNQLNTVDYRLRISNAMIVSRPVRDWLQMGHAFIRWKLAALWDATIVGVTSRLRSMILVKTCCRLISTVTSGLPVRTCPVPH